MKTLVLALVLTASSSFAAARFPASGVARLDLGKAVLKMPLEDDAMLDVKRNGEVTYQSGALFLKFAALDSLKGAVIPRASSWFQRTKTGVFTYFIEEGGLTFGEDEVVVELRGRFVFHADDTMEVITGPFTFKQTISAAVSAKRKVPANESAPAVTASDVL